MPDWAIVLVAAFGGGLAGAVLQPVTTHIFERIRSQERIRKTRERQLRRMLSAYTNWSASLLSKDVLLRMRQKVGNPFSPEEKVETLTVPAGLPAWEPQRIPDDSLQRAARDHYRFSLELYVMLWMPQPDDGTRRQVAEQLAALKSQITARMDELNWPEVED